jgi:hypothetical protein
MGGAPAARSAAAQAQQLLSKLSALVEQEQRCAAAAAAGPKLLEPVSALQPSAEQASASGAELAGQGSAPEAVPAADSAAAAAALPADGPPLQLAQPGSSASDGASSGAAASAAAPPAQPQARRPAPPLSARLAQPRAVLRVPLPPLPAPPCALDEVLSSVERASLRRPAPPCALDEQLSMLSQGPVAGAGPPVSTAAEMQAPVTVPTQPAPAVEPPAKAGGGSSVQQQVQRAMAAAAAKATAAAAVAAEQQQAVRPLVMSTTAALDPGASDGPTGLPLPPAAALQLQQQRRSSSPGMIPLIVATSAPLAPPAPAPQQLGQRVPPLGPCGREGQLSPEQQLLAAASYDKHRKAERALRKLPRRGEGWALHVAFAAGPHAGASLPVEVGAGGGVRVRLPGREGFSYVRRLRKDWGVCFRLVAAAAESAADREVERVVAALSLPVHVEDAWPAVGRSGPSGARARASVGQAPAADREAGPVAGRQQQAAAAAPRAQAAAAAPAQAGVPPAAAGAAGAQPARAAPALPSVSQAPPARAAAVKAAAKPTPVQGAAAVAAAAAPTGLGAAPVLPPRKHKPAPLPQGKQPGRTAGAEEAAEEADGQLVTQVMELSLPPTPQQQQLAAANPQLRARGLSLTFVTKPSGLNQAERNAAAGAAPPASGAAGKAPANAPKQAVAWAAQPLPGVAAKAAAQAAGGAVAAPSAAPASQGRRQQQQQERVAAVAADSTATPAPSTIPQQPANEGQVLPLTDIQQHLARGVYASYDAAHAALRQLPGGYLVYLTFKSGWYAGERQAGVLPSPAGRSALSRPVLPRCVQILTCRVVSPGRVLADAPPGHRRQATGAHR